MESTDRERQRGHTQAIDELVKSTGWAVFVARALQDKDIAEQRQMKAASPHELGIAVGVAQAIKQMLDWPRRELAMARAQAQEDLRAAMEKIEKQTSGQGT